MSETVKFILEIAVPSLVSAVGLILSFMAMRRTLREEVRKSRSDFMLSRYDELLMLMIRIITRMSGSCEKDLESDRDFEEMFRDMTASVFAYGSGDLCALAAVMLSEDNSFSRIMSQMRKLPAFSDPAGADTREDPGKTGGKETGTGRLLSGLRQKIGQIASQAGALARQPEPDGKKTGLKRFLETGNICLPLMICQLKHDLTGEGTNPEFWYKVLVTDYAVSAADSRTLGYGDWRPAIAEANNRTVENLCLSGFLKMTES